MFISLRVISNDFKAAIRSKSYNSAPTETDLLMILHDFMTRLSVDNIKMRAWRRNSIKDDISPSLSAPKIAPDSDFSTQELKRYDCNLARLSELAEVLGSIRSVAACYHK